MAKFEISLDTKKGPYLGEPVRARSGEILSCVIEATVTAGGTDVGLDATKFTAHLCVTRPDGTYVREASQIVDGKIKHTLSPDVVKVPGQATAYFDYETLANDFIDTTQSFPIIVEPGVKG